jgi:predicted GTPase
MLENLGLGERLKGRKDLRGKKVIFVDDGSNTYRSMCFTIASKLVKVVEVEARPKPRPQRPINRR